MNLPRGVGGRVRWDGEAPATRNVVSITILTH